MAQSYSPYAPLPQSDIVAITAGGPHAWIMINALRARFGDFPVIVEKSEPEAIFWKRRQRILGRAKTASMKAARLPLSLTKRGSQKLISEIILTHFLQPEPSASVTQVNVSSVNSYECRKALQEANPKAVFVIDARKILTTTQNWIDAPFIHYHPATNLACRGKFGAYFALANGEPEHFGATVHLLNEGAETGEILYQSRVEVDRRDNFHTYLWRLAAGSREIVIRALEDALAGDLAPRTVDLPSKQYSAPTLGGYVWTGVSRGVW